MVPETDQPGRYGLRRIRRLAGAALSRWRLWPRTSGRVSYRGGSQLVAVFPRGSMSGRLVGEAGRLRVGPHSCRRYCRKDPDARRPTPKPASPDAVDGKPVQAAGPSSPHRPHCFQRRCRQLVPQLRRVRLLPLLHRLRAVSRLRLFLPALEVSTGFSGFGQLRLPARAVNGFGGGLVGSDRPSIRPSPAPRALRPVRSTRRPGPPMSPRRDRPRWPGHRPRQRWSGDRARSAGGSERAHGLREQPAGLTARTLPALGTDGLPQDAASGQDNRRPTPSCPGRRWRRGYARIPQ